MSEPFYFRTQAELVHLLGVRAKNPAELRDGIARAPALSIYYHTHRYLQQHHYLSPEPPNDFAYWLTGILGLRELGEGVASIDVVTLKSLEDIRTEFLNVLERYLTSGKSVAEAPEGSDFHFMSCRVFVLPTPYEARDPAGFVEALGKVSARSIYYHVFEAKMRLEWEENDFAAWFRGLGETKVADSLSALDPYTFTLEGLRAKIIAMVREHAGIA